MYIGCNCCNGGGYYVGTEQHSRRACFLVLVQPDDDIPDGKHNNLRGFVRKVALAQFGNFMMGVARIHNQSVIISGAYGSDGLPKTVSRELWQKGEPLPDDLYDKWANGGGWNSCGSEAMAMRKWALETMKR